MQGVANVSAVVYGCVCCGVMWCGVVWCGVVYWEVKESSSLMLLTGIGDDILQLLQLSLHQLYKELNIRQGRKGVGCVYQ